MKHSVFIPKVASPTRIALSVSASHADKFLLRSSVGQCECNYVTKDIRQTKCSAKALLVNSPTSGLFSCQAVVEGDQYVAPSVAETAPDVIDCTFVGQQFPAKGSYLADDTARRLTKRSIAFAAPSAV